MGLLFELLFQFLLEIILQVIGEALVETVSQKLWGALSERKTLGVALALILYLGLGVITGWLSTLIFPHAFIRSSKLHGISLLITPTIAGLAMSGIGWIRRRQGKPVLRLDTFGYGFVFAFGMALIRFLFTT
ncbi:MAG: hypothetical protein H7Z38_22950 [Rubrivivax sp.]|nr:hypothetical protein [Pyrinomonadaceae bacterium]